MSIQENINNVLSSAAHFKGVTGFKEVAGNIENNQKEVLEAQKNQLLEMRKIANKHLKDVREARQEQRKEFNYNISSRVLKDPRDIKVREATAEAGMKYSKAIQEHEEAKADRREIIKKQKELEDK